MHRRGFLNSLIALTLALSGCGRVEPAPKGNPDAPDPSQLGEVRIVVLAPALGVICQDLGMEDQIVGKHAWDQSLGASIPSVGTHDDPDLETIVRLDPTHVLVQRMEAATPGALEQMAAEQGWTLWGFALLDLDDIAHAIDDIHVRFGNAPSVGFDPAQPGSIDPSDALGAEMPSARLADAWRDRGPNARAAGRVLLLSRTDPPGAMGPGSYHHQLLERLGAEPALTAGKPWQELDHEDIVRLAPDSIIVFAPRARDAGGVGAGGAPGIDDAVDALGGIATLDLPAIRDRRVWLIDDPLGLMPASSLARVADRMGEAFDHWSGDSNPDP